jgi:hypothetical protein
MTDLWRCEGEQATAKEWGHGWFLWFPDLQVRDPGVSELWWVGVFGVGALGVGVMGGVVLKVGAGGCLESED